MKIKLSLRRGTQASILHAKSVKFERDENSHGLKFHGKTKIESLQEGQILLIPTKYVCR